MSIFKQTKDAMMLLITVFVLIFITGFLFLVLGNYQIGSAIDVSWEERELVMLRTLKCLENDENLEDCIKTSKHIIKVEKNGEELVFINKDLYETLKARVQLFPPELYPIFGMPKFSIGDNEYEINVWFKG